MEPSSEITSEQNSELGSHKMQIMTQTIYYDVEGIDLCQRASKFDITNESTNNIKKHHSP